MKATKKPYGIFIVLLLAVTVAFASMKSYLKSEPGNSGTSGQKDASLIAESNLYQTSTIKFDADVVTKDFKVGDDGRFEFWFVNNGRDRLIISEVKSSCPCAIAVWPTTGIAPGKRDKVVVTYDTAKPGPINKSVTVISNGSANPVILRLKGKVSDK